MKKTLSFLFACFFFSLMADVRLDPVFSSGMVLQQGKPVAFFGTCSLDETVTVEFAGKKSSAEIDGEGNWKAVFPAMTASETAYEAVISGDDEKIRLKNLFIGDVWFCAGDANMLTSGIPRAPFWQDKRGTVQQMSGSSYFHAVQQAYQAAPYHIMPAKTTVISGSPDDILFMFGSKLQKKVKVPVGLISSMVSNSKIQGWISFDGYRDAGLTQELNFLEKFSDPRNCAKYEDEERQRYAKEMKAFEDLFEGKAVCRDSKSDLSRASSGKSPERKVAEAREYCKKYAEYDYDDSTWEYADSQSRHTGPSVLVRWFRNRFSIDPVLKDKDLYIKMGFLSVAACEVWINGVKVASWKRDDKKNGHFYTSDRISHKLFHHDKENVIAVRCIFFSMSRFTLWTACGIDRMFWDPEENPVHRSGYSRLRFPVRTVRHDPFPNAGWLTRIEYKGTDMSILKYIPKPVVLPYKMPSMPTSLFNGMVKSWTRLPVKGIVWAQGGSDCGDPRYYLYHKALIADWRKQWNDPELPFIIVQIPGNYGGTSVSLTRDIQQQMLKFPKVGLVGCIDAAGKRPVISKRLTLEALRIAYGRNIVSQGPLFREAKPEGGSIRVFFDNAENGLAAVTSYNRHYPAAASFRESSVNLNQTTNIRGFMIAGDDKKFVTADAVIDGNTVLVSSRSVPTPKFVRYAYDTNCNDLNLQNRAGLPAYPFRSDAYDYASVK